MNPESDQHGHGAPNSDGIKTIAAVPRSRRPGRPAAVMVLAPILGMAIWIGLFTLL